MHTRHHTRRSGARHHSSDSTIEIKPDGPARRRQRTWLYSAIAGIAFLLMATAFSVANIEARFWTNALAVVISSSREVFPYNTQRGTVRASNTTIEYEYEADGNLFQGNGTYPTGEVRSAEVSTTDRTRVWIIYNPKNPKESTIRPGLPVFGLAFAILGVLFLVGSVIGTEHGRRQQRKPSSGVPGAA